MIALAQVVTCDRCGKTILLAQLKDDVVFLDNVARSFPVYEEPPEGWTDKWGNQLCPQCSDIMDGLLREFFGSK